MNTGEKTGNKQELGNLSQTLSMEHYQEGEVIVQKSNEDAVLKFFFLNLLMELQNKGTAPAMDILESLITMYNFFMNRFSVLKVYLYFAIKSSI